MRAVVQRVSQASVAVDGHVVGAIEEPGLLVLVGVTHDDTPEQAARLAAKLWGLRILDGEKVLLRHWRAAAGDQPVHALRGPGQGAPPFLVRRRSRAGGRAPRRCRRARYARPSAPGSRTGVFGADMKVSLVNDGPVTIIVDL